MFSNLTNRLIVSFIAIPIILLLCYLGDIFFLIFVCAIIVLGLIEFFSLTKIDLLSTNGILSLLFALTIANLFYFSQIKYFTLYLFLFIAVISILELFKRENKSIHNLSVTTFGTVLIGLFYSTLIGIREFYLQFSNQEYYKGGYIVMTILCTIWICDSAAYFGGLSLGKHRLLERISPKKSWEGAIFGFLFSFISVAIAKLIFLDFLTWYDILYLGFVVGVVGQLGDLVESMIKRNVGIKDSSSLIPGHGGVLDRFDSLLFVSPFVYFYLVYVY